jgi:uncharacterized protein YbaP (TraB family)
MSRRRGFRMVLAALAAMVVAAPGAAWAQPPVWVVKDKDSEVVLFGSVHILPPGLDWEPQALDRALAGADDLWFELPIDEATEAETGRLATQAGVLPPDQSLFKILPPKDGQRLMRVAAMYDVTPALLDRLQPWLAEIALAGGAYRKAGADAASGVEKTISAAARPQAERHAFETPAEQIAILSQAPRNEQIASLRQTMEEMETKPDQFGSLIKAWVDGDMAALDREAIAEMRKAAPTLFRTLVTDRNVRWTKMLDQRLKGHGHTVVVVGVGHLIGPGGVPARLRALGYSVTGP